MTQSVFSFKRCYQLKGSSRPLRVLTKIIGTSARRSCKTVC